MEDLFRIRSSLVQFTVYEQPGDAIEGFPFVVRPWRVGAHAPGAEPYRVACLCASLEEARAPFEDRLFCLSRLPGDDPVIVEVWM